MLLLLYRGYTNSSKLSGSDVLIVLNLYPVSWCTLLAELTVTNEFFGKIMHAL